MQNHTIIQDKINAATSGLAEPHYGNKLLEAIQPDASELFDLFRSAPSNENELSDFNKKLTEHSFFLWLNSKNEFNAAKQILFKKINAHENINPFILEFVVCSAISLFTHDELLEQQVLTAHDEREAIKALNDCEHSLNKIKKMITPNEDKIHLIKYLLNNIKTELSFSENRCIYSAKKNHSYLARQILTNRIFQELYYFLKEVPTITNNFLIRVTQTISEVFYTAMEKKNAQELLTNIKKSEDHRLQFWESKVGDLLTEHYKNVLKIAKEC